MANSNPETVSTDFDTSDRLYFEPLDEESVLDILENEARTEDGAELDFPPSIVQFGGQTAINLSQTLDSVEMPILGSTARSIDIASDRHLFEEFLARTGIPNPPGAGGQQPRASPECRAARGLPRAGTPPVMCWAAGRWKSCRTPPSSCAT